MISIIVVQNINNSIDPNIPITMNNTNNDGLGFDGLGVEPN